MSGFGKHAQGTPGIGEQLGLALALLLALVLRLFRRLGASRSQRAEHAPRLLPQSSFPAAAPTPKPAIKPPPTESPPPAPTPPPVAEVPTTGEVVVSGDAHSVWLVGGGKRVRAGQVAPGTYEVQAFFDPVKGTSAGRITVVAGERVELKCSSMLLKPPDEVIANRPPRPRSGRH